MSQCFRYLLTRISWLIFLQQTEKDSGGRQLLLTQISTDELSPRVCVCHDTREGLQDASRHGGGRRTTTTISSDQSPWRVHGGVSAHVHPPLVSLVWVPRARPQTYHFFGDSRRGNILVLVLVLVLASSPRHTALPVPSPVFIQSLFLPSTCPCLCVHFFPFFFSFFLFLRPIYPR